MTNEVHPIFTSILETIAPPADVNPDRLPWRIVKVPNKSQRKVIDDGGSVIATIYNRQMYKEGGSDRMKRAARLFCNAPYMLIALKTALPELKENLKEVGGCDHGVGLCVCPLKYAIQHVEEAIKAAEGTN